MSCSRITSSSSPPTKAACRLIAMDLLTETFSLRFCPQQVLAEQVTNRLVGAAPLHQGLADTLEQGLPFSSSVANRISAAR